MSNNIAVSITADVAGLQANRAVASAELKAFTKDLNDLAKTAKETGLTDGLRAQMLAAGDAVAKAKAQVSNIDAEIRKLTGTMGGLHGGTAGVTRELIVMGREAARGNFSRLTGSATILVQRLGLLTPTVLGVGAAIAAMALPFVAVAAAANSAAEDLAKFQNQTQLTGNFAGLTASQFEDMARRVAASSNVGVGSARNALMTLVASGRFTSAEILQLGRDAEKMSQLTGQSAKDVLDSYVKMADGPARYADEFNRTHNALSLAQLEEIHLLEDHGQKSAATAALVRDLTSWLDHQTVHMGPLEGAWRSLTTTMSNAWEVFKTANSAPDDSKKMADLVAARAAVSRPVGGAQFSASDNARVVAGLDAQIAALKAKMATARADADQTAHGKQVTAEGQEAYEKSHATFLSLKSSADQATIAVKALHDQMAARLAANPNDAEAKDYQANSAKYDQALRRKVDPADNKKAKAGPDQVSEWTEQLRAQEVASGEFFKDQTAAELAYWQSHLALTTAGSRAWLGVQAKIFEASKTLAHQDYEQHIAALNDQLEADRDNWAKEQGHWAEKLAYIASKHGEQSAEYDNAHREFEAAERAHQEKMGELQRAGAADQFNALKAQIEAAKAIRDENAKTAESGIQQNAKYNPVAGEVQAAQQIAALHRQAAAQDLADEAQLQAAKDRQLEANIASYVKDSENYKKAVQAKIAADQEWAAKQQVMANKAANQQVADQQRIASAWHSTIDPMVSTVGTQFKGLIEGTESWKQALTHIADSALNMVIQALEKTAEKMIVNAIVGASAQKTTAMAQVAGYAGVAGAAGVASMAGAPFPLDLSAPEFGATMMQTALAFGAFAKGADVVPTDMVAQIHAGERIVPAADNRAIIAALRAGPEMTGFATPKPDPGAGGFGGGAAAIGARGGDTHIHNNNYSPQVIAKGDFVDQLRRNSDEFFSMIQMAMRNGRLKPG